MVLRNKAAVLLTSSAEVVNGHHSGADSINFSSSHYFLKDSPGLSSFPKRSVFMYSWIVEYCILQSQKLMEKHDLHSKGDTLSDKTMLVDLKTV